jgi:two-component system chemotaxis response regulator CheB
MFRRDIIVIGASAGGVEALLELVSNLPQDLPAAILVVIHTTPTRPNHLPQVLNYRSQLPAHQAQQGQSIEPGHIYIAPSDLHMLVRNGKLELNHGPRENNTRPAIDPLFRSAARHYGPRVIGIILSGNLGDGATGLMMIKSYGGIAMVQAPDEAAYSSMPNTAISYGQVDHILPVKEMAPLLVQLVNENLKEKGATGAMESDVTASVNNLEPTSPAEGAGVEEEERPDIINQALSEQEHNLRGGQSSIFSCPDCSGVLWQIDENGVTYFQCHVGHRLSPEVLLIRKSDELETALWSCVRTLQEKATLNFQLAAQMRSRGQEEGAARIEEKAEVDKRTMKILREQILDVIPNPMEQTYAVLEELGKAGGAYTLA